MAEYILETADLTKEFAGFVAVNGVSLKIERGTIHALIGPNGAGKTTCFNLLTKFLQPTHGRIVYKGEDITALPPAEVARLGMVRSFQISAVFPHLTVLENVRIALQRQRGGSFDFWRSRRVLDAFNDRARSLIADVGLSDVANTTAVELPYGRKRALEIATTLALDPEMLLLDEPTEGLAPVIIQQIGRTIRTLKEQGFTILLVEQNFRFASTVADRYYVMEHGRVVEGFDNADLNANLDKLHEYLGV
jgi:branched-chain amino acid transport system ATP-binding protein